MIYLDNASTTKPSKAVIDAMVLAAENFGNPSSLHRLGMDAEKIIKSTKTAIGNVLSVETKNIYFTSGGTESNNMAIYGYSIANSKRGKHLITTKVEHPSVLEVFNHLKESGFEVTYLNVTADGRIDLDEFANMLRQDTILVSVMHINNEVGTIQPVDKLKAIMNEKSPNAALHVDAVQSFCKIAVKPKKWGINLLSMSAHKIHGIKGIGALYIDGVRLKPLLIGGGQQGSIRSGTENVVGISAFGAAVREVDIDENYNKMMKLRLQLKNGLLDNIDRVVINGSDEYSSGNILNVSFLGIKAEILLHSLEARGIFVSTGSACSSNKPMPSHVLMAMGKSKEEIEGAIRFSLSKDVTKEDINICIAAVKEEVATIRKYTRK